jgi:phage shock protein A
MLFELKHNADAAAASIRTRLSQGSQRPEVLCDVLCRALPADLLQDITQHDQQQQRHTEQLEALQQQTADLESQLAAAHAQTSELEIQLELVVAERSSLQETAAELQQCQSSAKQQLLNELGRLHQKGCISATTR